MSIRFQVFQAMILEFLFRPTVFHNRIINELSFEVMSYPIIFAFIPLYIRSYSQINR